MTRITRIVTARTLVVLAVCCVAAPVASAKSVPGPNLQATPGSSLSHQIVNGVAPDQRAPQASIPSHDVVSGIAPDTRALSSVRTQHVASNSIAAEHRAVRAAELAQRPGVPSSQPVQVPAAPGNGFDWTDAAIGALVIAALALLALGGTMVPRFRNQRSSRTPLAG